MVSLSLWLCKSPVSEGPGRNRTNVYDVPPVIDQLTTQASYTPRRQPTRSTPTVASVTERISNSAARRQFAYSPVRFASHRTVAEDVRDAQDAPATYRGQFKAVKPATTKVNSGWETVK